MKKRAVVAMSGGVDSSVAALLACREGYDVLGVTLRLRDQAPEGAAEVCARLNIPFEEWDAREEFSRSVIAPFCAAYRAGRTPNPCVLCNRSLKFGLLMRRAEEQGIDAIFSGHYARIEEQDGRFLLKKGIDESKDQSYVLCSLTQRQIARLHLPLGGMSKDQTRILAAEAGFDISLSAPESQDICFVPDGDYCAFLQRETGPLTNGMFRLEDGRSLGRHGGLERYTIGQRRGLGIAWEFPLYVLEKNSASGDVVLGPQEHLLKTEIIAEDMNWIAFDAPVGSFRAMARTRYHQTETPCTVSPMKNGRAAVVFDHCVRAPAPGQAVVFYDGETVLGGGTII